jgi:hypothetical protein
METLPLGFQGVVSVLWVFGVLKKRILNQDITRKIRLPRHGNCSISLGDLTHDQDLTLWTTRIAGLEHRTTK